MSRLLAVLLRRRKPIRPVRPTAMTYGMRQLYAGLTPAATKETAV